MSETPITVAQAWRIRNERGLRLLPDALYETTELANIAIRQHHLFEKLDALDRELKEMACSSSK